MKEKKDKSREEKLLLALGEVDAALVARAIEEPEKKSRGILTFKGRLPRFTAAVAALLVVAIGLGVFFGNGLLALGTRAIESPLYPTMSKMPKNELIPGYDSRRDAWRADRMLRREYFGAGEGLAPFFAAATSAILTGGEENRVYSPLSTYMALAMLAEVTGGESRAEILTLLGAEDIESLRLQARAVWNANYCDDGIETSILASSIWLSDRLSYNRATLVTLADTYYASSVSGRMGSASYNRALRSWIDGQTGGLLRGQLDSLAMNEQTAIALVNTLYFKATWDDKFSDGSTRTETFHAPTGDLLCKFMHERSAGMYYWGESFSAVHKSLDESGQMWFILPDEGVTVNDLLSDSEALSFLADPAGHENRAAVMINLALPKFDVSSQLDLTGGLRTLGITSCLSPDTADFTPLGVADFPVYLESATQGARLTVDEEGVEAAVYTLMLGGGSAAPPSDEIDFVLDRPFLFVLTSRDGLPLFIGVVNEP
ncbi:MAG: hypothetical protein J6T24_08230 [Clostridia bacterium]|nr:hypothetical protein [Clostridia bacterium]